MLVVTACGKALRDIVGAGAGEDVREASLMIAEYVVQRICPRRCALVDPDQLVAGNWAKKPPNPNGHRYCRRARTEQLWPSRTDGGMVWRSDDS